MKFLGITLFLLQGETGLRQALSPGFQGRRFWRKKCLREKCFFLWVLPILFDTARERASKSAMEGFVPAKKLGLLSTREVRAFVTCGGWLQIWGLRKFSILERHLMFCANFQFYVEKHLMFAYSWTQRIESRINSIHCWVILIEGGKARQQPGNEEDYIELLASFFQGACWKCDAFQSRMWATASKVGRFRSL